MEMPNIDNVLKDEKNGITYNILAYRKMAAEEVIRFVRMYLSGKKVKKPKRGQRITIVTSVGMND